MITLAMESYNQISKEFDLNSIKIDNYLESAIRTLAINRDEAELKVLKESGTDEDLNILYEAAEEGFIVSIRNAIQAVIKSFKEFIKKIKDKIVVDITSAKAKNVLNTSQKKLKDNPSLAKRKVEIMNTKKVYSIIDGYKSKADRSAAKYKALTSLTNRDIENIDGIVSDCANFESDYNKVTKTDMALITVSLSTLLLLIDKEVKELSKNIDKIDKETSIVLDSLSNTISEDANTATKAAYTACANFRIKIAKAETDTAINSIKNKLAVLKSDLIKAKGNVEADEIKEESVYDDILGNDLDLFDEGANLDMRSILKDLKVVSKKNTSEAKKLIKKGDYDGAIKILKNNKQYATKAMKQVVNVDTTLGSAILGWFTTWTVSFRRDLLDLAVILLTGPAGAIYTTFKNETDKLNVEKLKEAENPSNLKNIDIGVLDTYKARVISTMKDYVKFSDYLIKQCMIAKKDDSNLAKESYDDVDELFADLDQLV